MDVSVAALVPGVLAHFSFCHNLLKKDSSRGRPDARWPSRRGGRKALCPRWLPCRRGLPRYPPSQPAQHGHQYHHQRCAAERLPRSRYPLRDEYNPPDLVSPIDSLQIQRGMGTSQNGGAAFGASSNGNTLDSRRTAAN